MILNIKSYYLDGTLIGAANMGLFNLVCDNRGELFCFDR